MSRWPPDVHSQVLELLADADVAPEHVIAVVETGSPAHAISVGSDDPDFTVIRLEPFEELVTGS